MVNTTYHPTDQVMAAHYARVADRLRTEAAFYTALAECTRESELLGTFAPQVAQIQRDAYTRMAEEIAEQARWAASISADYAACDACGAA